MKTNTNLQFRYIERGNANELKVFFLVMNIFVFLVFSHRTCDICGFMSLQFTILLFIPLAFENIRFETGINDY